MLDISDYIRDTGYVPIPGEWIVEIGAESDKTTIPGDIGGLTDADRSAFHAGAWSFVTVVCRVRDADRTVVGVESANGLISGHLPSHDTQLVPEQDRERQRVMAAAIWETHWDTLSDVDLIRSHLAGLEIEAHLAQKEIDRAARENEICPPEPGEDSVLISDVCARTIAELYHAGTGSPGYAFARTGVIPEQIDTLLTDLFRDLSAVRRRLRDDVERPSRGELFGDAETENLAAVFLRYLLMNGPRGDVEGWCTQSWSRGAQ